MHKGAGGTPHGCTDIYLQRHGDIIADDQLDFVTEIRDYSHYPLDAVFSLPLSHNYAAPPAPIKVERIVLRFPRTSPRMTRASATKKGSPVPSSLPSLKQPRRKR